MGRTLPAVALTRRAEPFHADLPRRDAEVDEGVAGGVSEPARPTYERTRARPHIRLEIGGAQTANPPLGTGRSRPGVDDGALRPRQLVRIVEVGRRAHGDDET